MQTRRTFLRVLGLVAVAPRILADAWEHVGPRKPRWTELLSPALYTQWRKLPEDFATLSTTYINRKYFISFRVTREFMQDAGPLKKWFDDVPLVGS